jgi:hypothetical protein
VDPTPPLHPRRRRGPGEAILRKMHLAAGLANQLAHGQGTQGAVGWVQDALQAQAQAQSSQDLWGTAWRCLAGGNTQECLLAGSYALKRIQGRLSSRSGFVHGTLATCFIAVPAFELAISQAIYHSKDLSEKNLT